MLDVLLFGALPYVAAALFLIVSIQRYRRDPFSFSSLSSQFLETRQLFWGSVPFHVGILTLFFGHLAGFLFPREVTLWPGDSIRIDVREGEGTSLGIEVLFPNGTPVCIIPNGPGFIPRKTTRLRVAANLSR